MSAPGEFTGWAIVELFGHQREIGFVTTEAFGQCVMFRVDVPPADARRYSLERPQWATDAEQGQVWAGAGTIVERVAREGRSRLIGPGAVYALNPCSEQAALEALESLHPRPLKAIELKADSAKQIGGLQDDDGEECDDGQEDDEREEQF